MATENRIAFDFSKQYGCCDELMRWLICLAFMWQLCFLWGFRLRVAPLSLSPPCMTHYKTSCESHSCHAQQTNAPINVKPAEGWGKRGIEWDFD